MISKPPFGFINLVEEENNEAVDELISLEYAVATVNILNDLGWIVRGEAETGVKARTNIRNCTYGRAPVLQRQDEIHHLCSLGRELCARMCMNGSQRTLALLYLSLVGQN